MLTQVRNFCRKKMCSLLWKFKIQTDHCFQESQTKVRLKKIYIIWRFGNSTKQQNIPECKGKNTKKIQKFLKDIEMQQKCKKTVVPIIKGALGILFKSFKNKLGESRNIWSRKYKN